MAFESREYVIVVEYKSFKIIFASDLNVGIHQQNQLPEGSEKVHGVCENV